MTNKYTRHVPYWDEMGRRLEAPIDVYDVLVAFGVTCPARQHAVKKLLCAGLRGKGDSVQDLEEAVQAVERAVSLERDRLEAARQAADDVLPKLSEMKGAMG